MFSESDNLYNLKLKSLRLIVAMNVNLTNLATRKHGSEPDLLIMARVIILCWNGAGSYAWGKIWLLCHFLREQMLISWIESSGQHTATQLELLGRRTRVVTAEGIFISVAR